MSKTSQDIESSSPSDNESEYSDELDESFEQTDTNGLKEKELVELTESFEDPIGVEDSKGLPDMDGLVNLLGQMKNVSRDKLMQQLQSLTTDGNRFGLGENDFSKVGDDHLLSARDKLRKKLEAKRSTRTSKFSKTYKMKEQLEKMRATLSITKEIAQKDGMGAEIDQCAEIDHDTLSHISTSVGEQGEKDIDVIMNEINSVGDTVNEMVKTSSGKKKRRRKKHK